MILAKLDIKGVNNNLVFVFSNGTYEGYLSILQDKVSSNPKLFVGSPVLFQGKGLLELSPENLAALQRFCLDYGMVLNNTAEPAASRVEKKPAVKQETKAASSDLILYKTLRSGQRVHSDGSVFIWGDVHESAEITAGKDVVVLGRLEGLAHAGCFGDISSTVFALQLSPRQIRIGDRFSRSTGELVKNNYPEIAFVEADTICIKEYTTRDSIGK